MMHIPDTLISEWKKAKQEEEAANKRRFDIECQIFEAVKNEIDGNGTYNFNGNMQIVCTSRKEWDQDKLTKIYQDFPVPILWPFKQEWKLLSASYKTLQEKFSAHADMLNAALTVKPNKPNFRIKD